MCEMFFRFFWTLSEKISGQSNFYKLKKPLFAVFRQTMAYEFIIYLVLIYRDFISKKPGFAARAQMPFGAILDVFSDYLHSF